jgi:hypothetical protein
VTQNVVIPTVNKDNIETPWPSDEADEQEMKDLLQKRDDLLRQLKVVEEDIEALLMLNSIKND